MMERVRLVTVACLRRTEEAIRRKSTLSGNEDTSDTHKSLRMRMISTVRGNHTISIGLIALILAGATAVSVVAQKRDTPVLSSTQPPLSVTLTADQPALVIRNTSAVKLTVDVETVLPNGMTQMAFDEVGDVEQVLVKAGQVVSKGVPLIKLDDTTRRDALERARLKLEQIKAEQAKTWGTPVASEADIAAARAAVQSAEVEESELRARPRPGDVEVQKRKWLQAKNQLWSAQIQRDGMCGGGRETPACHLGEAGVGEAFEGERQAHQEYINASRKATADELAAAHTKVLKARADLDKLISPRRPTPEDLRVDQLNIALAEADVAREERNLIKATLLSPCACVVQEVKTTNGARVDTQPVVTLIDLSTMVIRTTTLNERDVKHIAVGQPATVRLVSLDKPLYGAVRAVLPVSASNANKSALFSVEIELDPSDAHLLAGMTGKADIQIDK